MRKTEQNAFAAAGARELTLTAALGITGDEVVALVGGGGKTAAMFRTPPARVGDRGGRARHRARGWFLGATLRQTSDMKMNVLIPRRCSGRERELDAILRGRALGGGLLGTG